LQQVVWNLLSNAVKFTPSGGAVEVRLERVNSHAEITVSDSGQGISADFLPHVFEAFSQEDASTSRKHSGLGLGLAIVRQLVELHGGTIQVYSDGDGQGTTFKAKLPLVAPQASRSGEEPQKAAEPAREFPRLLSRLKVLVVDDALDSRDMLGLILEKAGADVRLASSAKEALKIVESWRPGLLIADIGMPEEDGYALIRQVRALKSQEGGMVPALALTGYASRQDRLQSILAGFQEHMTKPVEPEELIAVAADLVATAKKAGRRF
jgi:CheY-like chemotaxis protein